MKQSRALVQIASAPVFILRGALMQHDFVLARIRLTRTAAERGPVLFGECGQGTLLHHAFVLARIRLTRMAAERGPILSGACGQVDGFQTLVSTRLSVCEPPQ